MAKQGSVETLTETHEGLAELLARRLKAGKSGSTRLDAEELTATYDLYVKIWNELPRE